VLVLLTYSESRPSSRSVYDDKLLFLSKLKSYRNPFDSGSNPSTKQARIHNPDTLAVAIIGATSGGRGEELFFILSLVVRIF
jgi:hypothetical protein